VTPPLTDNQLSMYHSQTKLPLYFTVELNKLQETFSSASKVPNIIIVIVLDSVVICRKTTRMS